MFICTNSFRSNYVFSQISRSFCFLYAVASTRNTFTTTEYFHKQGILSRTRNTFTTTKYFHRYRSTKPTPCSTQPATMASRRKIILDKFSIVLTEELFCGRWTTDKEILRRILLNVNNAEPAYTYGELNKAISNRYPFLSDRHVISENTTLITLK